MAVADSHDLIRVQGARVNNLKDLSVEIRKRTRWRSRCAAARVAVMAHADWIIDLGPGAGHDGGRVVFAGLPADLAAARSILTGQHLAGYVS